MPGEYEVLGRGPSCVRDDPFGSLIVAERCNGGFDDATLDLDTVRGGSTREMGSSVPGGATFDERKNAGGVPERDSRVSLFCALFSALSAFSSPRPSSNRLLACMSGVTAS